MQLPKSSGTSGLFSFFLSKNSWIRCFMSSSSGTEEKIYLNALHNILLTVVRVLFSFDLQLITYFFISYQLRSGKNTQMKFCINKEIFIRYKHHACIIKLLKTLLHTVLVKTWKRERTCTIRRSANTKDPFSK